MSAVAMKRLDDRERELIAQIRVVDNVARYDSTERIADWAKIKKVMVALGGSWKGGKVAGFTFSDDVDAGETVRLAQECGEILNPDDHGFFPTPRALADHVVSLANVKPGERVIEPSAGIGALALAVLRECPTARITCIELLPANLAALHHAGLVAASGDFLSMAPDPTFSVVVMNPPFARRADIAHVEHAMRWLKASGRIVAIMSAGVMFRSDKMTATFRARVEAMGGYFEENPVGSFKESGTMVNTVTMVARMAGA